MNLALELVANAITTASIVLAGRNSQHTWWTGIAGGLCFTVLFFSAQLYADVTLQLFFIATSVTGWWRWQQGSAGSALPIRRSHVTTGLGLSVSGVVVAMAYGWLLHTYTDAYAPFIDSLVLAFSVIAQFLLVGRRLETWWCWLFVNTLSVPLYASRGLYITALLYAVYWINALVSWRHWRQLQAAEAP